MANIFSLYGTIFIDNEKANKSIDETTKKGKGAGTKMGSAFSTIAKGAASMGTAVVTAAATVGTAAYKMATSTAEQADYIDKLSERTGINREELQRWKHAADQSGVSVDSFKNGIKKMSDVIDDANNGSKTAATSIGRLGLSLDDLNTMSTEEKFNAITAALADMEEGSERNALGNDLLGKSYTEMLPLLNAGSDGIAGLKKEADDLGLVMSESTVKSGVKLGDTIANVKAAVNGLKNQIGAAAIPIIQKFADMLIAGVPTLITIFNGLTPVIISVFDNAIPPIMRLISNIFPVLITLIQSLLPFVETFISSLLPVVTDLLLMLLPPATQIVQLILPLLLSLLEPLFPLLQPILALLQPIIDMLMLILEPLIQLLNTVLPPLINIISGLIQIAIIPLQTHLSSLAGVIGGAFKGAFDLMRNNVQTAKNVFNGFIDFIKNVFTGNWKGAWTAVKNIFTSIFEGIKNGFKVPLNAIIDGINVFIRGLNRIEIPDWVPGVGGKGFNVREFKRLRIGLDYVPHDEFPALLHKGERVLTNAEARAQDARRTVGGESNKEVNVNVEIRIDNFNNNANEDLNSLADRLSEIITAQVNRQRAVFA